MTCRTRYHSLVFLSPTGANTSGGGSQGTLCNVNSVFGEL